MSVCDWLVEGVDKGVWTGMFGQVCVWTVCGMEWKDSTSPIT